MKNEFPVLLTSLRTKANLTNEQLAGLANVPRSLIGGLQSGRRRIGEMQATRIGKALGLQGQPLDEFIYEAINQCSEKVLVESKDYPAELLNLLARQLRLAGIYPELVSQCEVSANKVALSLNNGKHAWMETSLMVA